MRLLRPWLALLLLAPWALSATALADKVPGEPLRRSYDSDQTRAKPGHLALATSPDGELFTGNNEGVLRFNGIDWRLTTLPGRSPARALATGSDGLVYVGGYDTFGRLAPDGQGGLVYEELLDAAGLLGDQRHLGFVYQVIAAEDGIWFRTDERLYFLPGEGGKARHWPLGEDVRSFYLVDGQLLARIEGRGLVRFDPQRGSFELLPGGEALANVPLPAVLSHEDGLLLVARDGLHVASPQGLRRLEGPASRLLDGRRSYTARELDDGTIVVGTLDGELIRFDRDLVVRENLDLGSYAVIELTIDREGGLWVATENDLLRLSLPSRWSLLGDSQDIAGNPQDFEWHDGVLWLATSQGIQRLQPSQDGQPRAERLPWTEYEGYALHSTDAGLLMGVREGLLVLEPGEREPRSLFRHPHHGVYAMLPSTFRPDRLYALSGPNLMLLRLEAGRWQLGQTIPLEGLSLSGIEESAEGELWMGDTRGPVQRWRIDLDTGEVLGRRSYDDAQGLVVNRQFGTSVLRFEGSIRATSGDRSFRLEGDAFVPDLAPPATLVERTNELAVEETPLGDYAYTSRELWHRAPGEQEWQPLYPGGRGLGGYSYLRVGRDGVLRIATWTGLLQYDPAESQAATQPLQLGMELVTARDEQGQQLSLPTRTDAEHPVTVPAGHSLTLRFAMVSMESGAEFRYLLHGVTPGWSEWADRDLFIRALPAGDYALEVQARTGTGRQPAAMTYRFRVLPRWHEQWWVRGLGLLALLGAGVLAALWGVRLRTERFLADNRRLEARIAERTHELEDANRRLAEMATEDALTGVSNRRALENGLRREWYRCLDQRRPLSVLMIDVDHFKSYNDAHGHLEGDVQLRGIAQRLAREHDPQRELLARYGGEEFALLLPGVHLAEATRRAEAIRLAIAASDAGMTVSIGVAGAVPEVQAEPDSLLRRADAALYAAKRAGRNRVATDAG